MSTELLLEEQVEQSYLLKWRAPDELAELLQNPIYKGKNVPHGEGQRLVVIPGIGESKRELCYLIAFLTNIGYSPETPDIKLNYYNLPSQNFAIAEKIAEIAKTQVKVPVLGHSMGGFIGFRLAQEDPNIEKVIALGAPFLNYVPSNGRAMIESIYSPNDGLVLNATSTLRGPNTKNVEVRNPNHFGLLCHSETFAQVGFALAS